MKEQLKFSPEEIQELSKGLTRQAPQQKSASKKAERVVTIKNVTYTEEEFAEATSKNNITNLNKKSSPATKTTESNKVDLISNIERFATKYKVDLSSITYSEVVTKISDPNIKEMLIQKTSTGSGQNLISAIERIYSSDDFSSAEKRRIDFSVKKAIREIDAKNREKISRGF